MKFVAVLLTLCMCGPALAAGSGETWEQHLVSAQLAFDHNDYLQARRMFSASVEEAERSQEDLQLAKRLEDVAEDYAGKRRPKVAEAIHRKAIQIYQRKLGATHLSVVASIQRLARLLRMTDRQEEASDWESRAKVILAHHRSS